MATTNDDFKISFFKPTTPQATANRNLVILLVSIWVVAIFGFQILLRIFEKPTPETTYIAYENVSEAVFLGNVQKEERQVFSQSLLSVMGKLYVTPEDKQVLGQALSWTVFHLLPEEAKDPLRGEVKQFEMIREKASSITDSEYLSAKQSVISTFSPYLGLEEYSLEAKLLPFGLVSEQMTGTTPESLEQIPAIMSKYLIHNQSFLTDMKFLGFPFHYFYTAVFLLILFVGLCWFYCVRIDRLNRNMNIAD